MRPCPNCGQMVELSANFCHMCGQRLPALEAERLPVDTSADALAAVAEGPLGQVPDPLPDVERDAQRPRKRVWLWPFIAVATVLVLATGAVLWMGSPDSHLSDHSDGQSSPSASTDGSGQSASPTPDPRDVMRSRGTSRVRLTVTNCAACEIAAIPADGSREQTATVSSNAVEFSMKSASTLGLAFAVHHPGGYGSDQGPNLVVLAPTGSQAGERVTVSQLIATDTAAVCWAGTVEETALIPVVVDLYDDGTPTGGLRAWTDPAQATASAASPFATVDGTLDASAASECRSAWGGA